MTATLRIHRSVAWECVPAVVEDGRSDNHRILFCFIFFRFCFPAQNRRQRRKHLENRRKVITNRQALQETLGEIGAHSYFLQVNQQSVANYRQSLA